MRDAETRAPVEEVGDVVAGVERARGGVELVRDGGEGRHGQQSSADEVRHLVGMFTQQHARLYGLGEGLRAHVRGVERVKPLGQVLLHRQHVLVFAPVTLATAVQELCAGASVRYLESGKVKNIFLPHTLCRAGRNFLNYIEAFTFFIRVSFF